MTTDGLTPSEQVALYEATDGREGGTLEDRPVVILTTVGVKSGELRKTPVMRIVDGHNYLAVASAGGATSHPAWYRNLVANPDVWLQDGATVRRLRARRPTALKTRLWGVAEQFWPHFPQYRASAGDREIPVIVLEPLVGGDN